MSSDQQYDSVTVSMFSKPDAHIGSARVMVEDRIVGLVPAFVLNMIGGSRAEAQILTLPTEVDLHFMAVEGSEAYRGKILRAVVKERVEEQQVEGEYAPKRVRIQESAIYDGDSRLDDIVVARIFADVSHISIRGEVYTQEDYMAKVRELQESLGAGEEDKVSGEAA